MNNTAVEDLFLREEAIENSATCNVQEISGSDCAALTYATATNGGVYKLTSAGTVGGTARAKGTFLRRPSPPPRSPGPSPRLPT